MYGATSAAVQDYLEWYLGELPAQDAAQHSMPGEAWFNTAGSREEIALRTQLAEMYISQIEMRISQFETRTPHAGDATFEGSALEVDTDGDASDGGGRCRRGRGGT